MKIQFVAICVFLALFSAYTVGLAVEDTQEQIILNELYANLNGPQWSTDPKQWVNSSSPVCSRAGITCQSIAQEGGVFRVTKIKLVTDKGAIPDSVTNLKYLEEFTINGPPFALGPDVSITYIPSQIGKLTRLKLLEVVKHSLRKLPTSITDLVNLETLKVSYGLLIELPSDLNRLVNLTTLIVSSNQIRELPVLSGLAKLKKLEAKDNLLTDFPPSLASLSNLEYLFASNNILKTLDNVNWSGLTKMKELLVSRNRLASLPTFTGNPIQELNVHHNLLHTCPDLSTLKSTLTYLDMSHNFFVTGHSSISELTELTFLDLGFNKNLKYVPSLVKLVALEELKISSCILESVPLGIEKMIELYTLDLSFNNLNEIGFPDLSALEWLDDIDLASNRFTAIPPSFAKLSYLFTLDMRNNMLTNEGIPDLSGGIGNSIYSIYLMNNFLGPGLSLAFAALTSLVHADFSGNPIVKLDSSSLAFGKNVGRCRFENCGLIEISSDLATLMPKIHALYLGNNRLIGIPKPSNTLFELSMNNNLMKSIPNWIGTSTHLKDLNFAVNHGIREIPEGIFNNTEMRVLVLAGTSIEALPPGIDNVKKLRILALHETNLKVLPDEIGYLKNIQLLTLWKTQLTNLTSEIGMLENLEFLSFHSNNIEEIPSSIGNLTKLKYLDGSHCKIKSIDNWIEGVSKTLVSLQLQNNLIEWISLPSISRLGMLQHLDLSSNLLIQGGDSVLSYLGVMANLTTCLLSGTWNNNAGKVNELALLGQHFKSLIVFSLANNGLEGDINSIGTVLYTSPLKPLINIIQSNQIATQSLTNLYKLDISNNQLSGSMNEYFGGITPLQFLSEMKLEGNTELVNPKNTVPSFLEFDDSVRRYNDTGNFYCSALKGRLKEMAVQMNPSYYGYGHCFCYTGYFGQPPACTLCPKELTTQIGQCEKGVLQLREGWWLAGAEHGEKIDEIPTANQLRENNYLIRCIGDLSSGQFSNCQGTSDETGVFKCREGTTGKQCSECMPGFYRDGTECRTCGDTASWTLFLMITVALVVLLTWTAHQKPKTSGGTKIFMFFCQCLVLLLSRARFAEYLNGALTVSRVLSVGNGVSWTGLDCLVQNESAAYRYAFKFYFIAAVPLMFAVFAPIVFIAGWYVDSRLRDTIRNGKDGKTVKRISVHQTSADDIVPVQKLISTVLFLLLFAYIPVSTALLSVISTDKDPSSGKYYLRQAPWILTTNSMWRTGILPIAVLGLVLFTAGYPCYLVYKFIVYHGKLEDVPPLRLLWTSYRDGISYFELVLMSRRLLLAIVLAIFAFDSPWVPVFVFSILLLSIVIQLFLSPFKVKAENNLEVASLFVLLVSYLAGVILNGELVDQFAAQQMAIVVFVLNGIMFTTFVLYLSQSVSKKMSEFFITLRKKIGLGRNKMEKEVVEMNVVPVRSVEEKVEVGGDGLEDIEVGARGMDIQGTPQQI